MDFNDALNKLKDNPELAKKLEEAFRKKVGVEELTALLDGAGFDANVIEPFVAEYQRKIGTALADEDVDEETLARIAGGSDDNDCDEEGSWSHGYYCDEVVLQNCDSILF